MSLARTRDLAETAIVAYGILGFVGRQVELAALRDALAAAKLGRGSTWLLVGEPGIGKTRVIEEIAREAEGAGFATLWGRCWEAGGAPAFWPWIQIARDALRHAESAMVTASRAPHLVQLVPELRERYPDLPEPPPLGGDSAQFMLLDSVASALCAAARTQPLLLALDDVHVATPSSLALLELLANQARGAPLVIVATHRPEARGREEDQALRRLAQSARTLVLAPLERADVARFLDQAIGQPSDELVTTAVERSEGNPLFLVELSRLLIARGSVPTDALPPTLRTALQQRLEVLSPATREILELASACGREFSPARIAGAFARSPDEVHAALAEASDAAVVAPVGAGTYRFRHILLREVVHQELAPERRQQLHLQLARWLETYGVDRVAIPWSEIAHHYFAAGEQGRDAAIDASERAAQQAVATLAFAEAIASYRAALQMVDVARHREPRRRAELMIGLGHAQLHGGDPQTGRDTCLAAAALARELGAPELLAHAALELGSVLTFANVDPVLVALLEEALLALGTGHDRLRARVMSRLAAAMQPAQDPRAPIALALDAVALARTTGDQRTLLATLGSASSAMIDHVGAEDRIPVDREHVTLATAVGDRPEQLRGQIRLALATFELGDAVGAHAAVDAARSLASRLAHPFYGWRGAALDAMLALWEGRFGDAERAIEDARRLGERGGDPNVTVAIIYQSMRLARLTGRRDVIRANASRALQLFTGTPVASALARVFAAAASLQLAHVPPAIDASDLEHALRDRASFEPAAELISATGDRALAARFLERLASDRSRCVTSGVVGLTWGGPLARVRALLEHTLGRLDDAIASLTSALDTCRNLGGRPMIARTAYELAALYTERGDTATARTLLDEATALAAELGMELGRGSQPHGIATPPAPSAPLRFELVQAGDVWSAARGDVRFQLRDGKGVRYLARLVAEPRREVHVLDLADALDTVDAGDAGELLDPKARDAYKQRIESLEEDLADAERRNDLGAAERANHELQALQAELARAFGVGGRARRTGSAAERARINVQRRLRAAIAQIATHDAALGRHLERSVRTGVFCCYEPD